MNKFDELQMLYKVKAGKSVYLDAPGPEDARVLDEDEKELEERMRLKKGSRGPLFWDDPYAMATAFIQEQFPQDCPKGDPQKPFNEGPWSRKGDCAAKRDKKAAEIAAEMASGKKRKGGGSGSSSGSISTANSGSATTPQNMTT